MPLKPLAVLLLLCLAFIPLRAQLPGSFDSTYGIGGKTILPLGTANAFGRAVIIQPDGKSVLAGVANNGANSDFAIARFTTEGDPDNSLGEDGIMMTDFDGRTDIAEAIALDAFDRIVVAGSVDSGDGFGFAVARYLQDGTLDKSFGHQGLVISRVGITDFCKSVAIQSDHKVVLGGYVLNGFSGKNEFALMRFHTDGTPDSTFHDDGIVLIDMGIGSGVANAIFIQPDGKIVLAGQVLNENTFRWEIGIIRYNEDGSPDKTWDEDGKALVGSPEADYTIKTVVMQADHKIVVGGFFGTAPSNNLFSLARYHTDGRLDDTFGEGGIVLGSYGAQNNQVNDMVIQPDGQILIAGTSLQGNRDMFAVARLDPTGNFDETFGEHGVIRPVIDQNDGINSMALQQDGKLVVAGESFNGQRFSVVVARIETGLMTSAKDQALTNIGASVFPNPVRDELHVSFITSPSAFVRIVLLDQLGRIVYEVPKASLQDVGENKINFTIPMHLPNGVYTLGLVGAERVSGVQVVVMR